MLFLYICFEFTPVKAIWVLLFQFSNIFLAVVNFKCLSIDKGASFNNMTLVQMGYKDPESCIMYLYVIEGEAERCIVLLQPGIYYPPL